jgi:hypothetical protein
MHVRSGAFPFTSMAAFFKCRPWPSLSHLPLLSLLQPLVLQFGCMWRHILAHHHCTILIVHRWLSSVNVAHISLSLVILHHRFQLWVGRSLFFPLHYFDSRCPSPSYSVMAIADVLFLPWSSWAQLSFVSHDAAKFDS